MTQRGAEPGIFSAEARLTPGYARRAPPGLPGASMRDAAKTDYPLPLGVLCVLGGYISGRRRSSRSPGAATQRGAEPGIVSTHARLTPGYARRAPPGLPGASLREVAKTDYLLPLCVLGGCISGRRRSSRSPGAATQRGAEPGIVGVDARLTPGYARRAPPGLPGASLREVAKTDYLLPLGVLGGYIQVAAEARVARVQRRNAARNLTFSFATENTENTEEDEVGSATPLRSAAAIDTANFISVFSVLSVAIPGRNRRLQARRRTGRDSKPRKNGSWRRRGGAVPRRTPG